MKVLIDIKDKFVTNHNYFTRKVCGQKETNFEFDILMFSCNGNI